jgi:hypothetical protein
MQASGLHAHKFEFIVTKHSEKQCETHSFRMGLMIKPHVKIQIPRAISTRGKHVLPTAHSA